MKPFKRVTIIGTGLIGGSIGLALRKSKLERVGFDRPAVLREALKRKAIDKGAKDLAEAVSDVDLVILAMPVGDILEVLYEISRMVSPATVVTDTGSTKKKICERARAYELKNFVGGHPLAGKEKNGIKNAETDLFSGRNWFLCSNGSSGVLNRMKKFVRSLGAIPVLVDPEKHDRILAATSHLPQLVSTLLAASVVELLGKEANKIKTFAGPGLRDTTRLASSPFSVWGDVLASNQAEVEKALESFVRKTTELSRNLSNFEMVKRQFEIANKMRVE